MAFQRPFVVSLKKSDPQQSWGFRIFGGKEYGAPHVVEKITEDSIAERAGLREGDEIIQVGRVNIQDITFGQAQEVILRSGNKLEMFIIREDLLSPRKGKEPSHVKAVVHNPYNSPLNLYSTENIAETLAKQTEVLTEGCISPTEEEEGPENLSFKQKSAVFQLLEEQARQENVNPYQGRGSPQKKSAAPPPPKPKPPAAPDYHNKENYYYPEQPVQNAYSTTIQSQTYRSSPVTQNEGYYNQVNSIDYRKQEQRSSNYTTQAQHNFSAPVVNHNPEYFQTIDQRSTYKVVPAPPPRANPPSNQNTMTAVYRQQQPQYHEYQQTQQHYQEQQDVYQNQRQCPPQQVEQQKKTVQIQQYPQQQESQYHVREAIFENTSTVGTPVAYKAPPSQKFRVNWPPASPTQQNGQWRSPSPTPPSPSRANIESLWPPKQPSVKELPKTGFNPAVIREQSTGRRCVWPPPRSDDELRSGRTTPQSPVAGRRINWNPSPSPPTSRRSGFGSMSPVARRKDIQWPPPQPAVTKEVIQTRPSPTFTRKARFDDYVKLHASSGVPVAYRPPPGTQHVEYC